VQGGDSLDIGLEWVMSDSDSFLTSGPHSSAPPAAPHARYSSSSRLVATTSFPVFLWGYRVGAEIIKQPVAFDAESCL